ncbi:unnamed protein product [Cercopithifilaria johnstoni]|uniref:BPTI/Kunitz inhibitor domain-containing protein n=1 Tax=Cercopithifilaria johnstoni TaxID=2874296 RepID=A0A8J2M828_9BILA|nr:unnamed protein product [Cercopithifilaria johnstoni]
MNRELSFYRNTINACTKHVIISGARGTHLKHAIDGGIVPSNTEEFSHGSAAMHINTREHKGQEFIALNSENEVTLPATLNDFDIITDSINDNAIITTRKKPDLSPIIPKEWNMDPDGHKIVDKIDTILQNSLPDEFLMSTIIPTTTSSGETAQSVLENAAPSLASVSITLNNTHSAPTSVSSMKSINHITFSSNTAIPTNNNITSASKMIAIADNRIEGSLEPSIPSSMGILSQPIPSGKSWLYDGLQSTMNSKVFPEQYSQQELAEKKLSFGSFESAGTFPLETFKTAINNNNNLLLATTMMNTSKIPPMRTGNLMTELTSIQNLSPNAALNAAMDTTISSVELQTEKSVGQLGKSMKESEENYFNADSSIFMDAPNFQNQTLAILSLERIRNSNINTITEEPEFISNDTREAKKERSEGKTEMIGLSSSVHDFNNMSVKPKNEILHHSVTTIPRASAEIPASFAPSNSQTDILPHEDYRVNIVEGHNLHSLKHQELQRSPMENLDKIASQQSTAAHDIQMAQNIPLQTTIKQGETDDVERDETTVNVHQEKMESEIFNQQNISDSQITPETTPHAVVHGVTSLQQLQPEEDDTCVLPPDAGICRDYIPRWFYNSQTGKCEQFSYGSCGGNSNNFLDRQACEAKCSRDDSIKSQLPERCTYKKDEGYSNGYNVKWYYNVRNLRCEQMVYQGQGGNSNQFETFAECQTFCTPSDGKTTKQIAHPLKINSTGHPQSDFAASRNQENQTQTVSITGTDKISENHAYNISHNTAENPHHRIIPNNGSVGDKEIQQFSSKQHPTASSISSRSPIPTRSAQFSHSLDTSTNETIIVAEPSPDPSPPTNAMNESSDEVMERKFDSAKIFGETIVNKDNDVLVDLPSIFDGINHMPNCPNGLKPIQHADGRPVMCLPGRNQCSGNSVCYFNGVDFLCCPNTKDPYDEHIFGGYNGEEVKQGYKNVKKTPIKSNELIVRKLRLKRQTQVFTSRSSAARIDSKVQRSLSRASLAVNSSDGRQVDNICMQDANTGNCTEAHLRFFYDRRASTCRLFYYSGCGGNENNFVTEDECRRRCKSDNSHIDDAPLGSCPFGELPFGDNAPVICGKDAGSFECPKGYYCLTGPPNVCCLEKFLPGSEKILVTKKNQKNIRFSPQQSRRNADYLPEETQRESEEKSPMLLVPENICPDGSDALLDESTQQPLKCGVGYDGESFCPLGYYCSIDSERNGRLCCQLGIIGVKIPPPPRVPPYFGLRPSNPGEVISRGSLPSDYISQKQHETGILNIAKPSEGYSSRLAVKRLGDSHKIGKETTDSYGNFVPSDEATDSFENLTPSDSKLEGEIYGRMMLNSNDRIFRTQALYNSMNNADSPEAETNEVQIDVGEIKDPFESLEYAQKTTSDRSICLLKPNEGRICREDESPPRTNLQYFYSNRDKRCKLYFYRGCGGSQNRFDTKRHCELTCAVRRVTLITEQLIDRI